MMCPIRFMCFLIENGKCQGKRGETGAAANDQG